VLAVAAVLCAIVFALRVVVADPSYPVTLLFALPIALLAIELGLAWGLAAAAVALALFAVWQVLWSPDVGGTAGAFLTRGAAFFMLGGFVGALADGLRKVSAENERFWELSSDLLCSIGFDGHLQRLNPAWERTLGWTPEELRAHPVAELVHPEDRQLTELELGKLIGGRDDASAFENR
jgi:PAS domain-containing protein